MNSVPSNRLRSLNDTSVNDQGDYVLYWMTMNRRSRFNYSLDRAIEWSRDLGKPLIVFEALRCGYKWASDRLHRFIIEGMAENVRRFKETKARYFPYIETELNAGKGLLESLAANSCVVVTDDFPCFFIPTMLKYVAPRVAVKLETADSNGILPMRVAPQVFARAFTFRRYLQKNLPPFLNEAPAANPLNKLDIPTLRELPKDVVGRWSPATEEQLSASSEFLSSLPIDHDVAPAAFAGGESAAGETLATFMAERFEHYGDDRSRPDVDVASGLSPYLHFGHISAHEVFQNVVDVENWSPKNLNEKTGGQREGWWGMSDTAESFLDELITWRELGYNMCWQDPRYDRYETLPEWAQKTLSEHEEDARSHIYSLDDFERATTHDELWNAAQNQLVLEGKMQNYLRMLWGKKIVEWSETPRDALATMIHLNNKYAVDGRNPNSYSGIFWVLGRYDRAWGPERPVYGKIRYMSSDNTARKFKVKDYVAKYSNAEVQRELF